MAIEMKMLPTIGMEAIGLDLDREIDPSSAVRLRTAWAESGLILFRGIGTSPARLLRLSRVFGETEPHPIKEIRLPEEPDLILLTNKGGLRGPVYAFDNVPTYGLIPWHTDLAFSTVPNAGALLNMVETASIGGRTAWLDTELAYASLDHCLKERLVGLEALFEFCADLGQVRFCNPNGTRVGEAKSNFPDYPPIAKPIIYRHPVTGREVLNVCPLNLQGVVGLPPEKSDTLLRELIGAMIRPEFIYEHDWAEGDIMLWDNYRMMHRAEGHPVDVIRVAHRTTLRGRASVGRIMTQ